MVKGVRGSDTAEGASKAPLGRAPRRITLREALLESLEPEERAEFFGLQRATLGLYRYLTPSRKQQRYLDLCNKGWGLLLPHLSSGEYICTGCKPEDPFAPRRAIEADRWANAKINYENWRATIGDAAVIEIEISTIGGLHISRKSDQVRLGIFHFRLGVNLPVFVTLAEGARASRPLVPLDELKQQHFSGDDSALGLAIHRIKEQMSRAGMDKEIVDFLVRNEPRAGYRLNMPPAEIAIED